MQLLFHLASDSTFSFVLLQPAQTLKKDLTKSPYEFFMFMSKQGQTFCGKKQILYTFHFQ